MSNPIFDLSNIKIGSEVLKYDKNKQVIRIISLIDLKNKNLYFKTNYYNEGELCVSGRYVKPNEKMNMFLNVEKRNDLAPGLITVQDLNKLKSDLINKFKHIINIPDASFDPQTMYIFGAYINESEKISQILEYKDKTSDISVKHIPSILRNCKCAVNIHLKSMIITSTGLHLQLRLVRIYPEDINSITDAVELNNVYNDINSKTIYNISKIKELSTLKINRSYHTKGDVKDQLKTILKS